MNELNLLISELYLLSRDPHPHLHLHRMWYIAGQLLLFKGFIVI